MQLYINNGVNNVQWVKLERISWNLKKEKGYNQSKKIHLFTKNNTNIFLYSTYYSINCPITNEKITSSMLLVSALIYLIKLEIILTLMSWPYILEWQ